MSTRAFAFGPVEISSGFLPAGDRFIHCVDYRPAGREPSDTVLLVPPFAEEMNHSRRMFHRFARRLAAGGRRVVLPDLHGTGDSSGHFAEATWDLWQADLAVARAWAATPGPVSALVALRLGAILAASHQREHPVDRLVLWDPVLHGRDQIRDFLRQRVLAERFGRPGPGSASLQELEASLAAGRSVEVSGYELAPALAAGIAALDLAGQLAGSPGTIHWLQLGPPDAGSPSGGSRAVAQSLQATTRGVAVTTVPGPRFWATSQSSAAPVLIDETERLLGT